MSYKSGDVEILLRPDWLAEDEEPEPGDMLAYDARDEKIAYPFAKLPHSCDSWIIGGPDEIRVMIADLQAALRLLGD